MKVRYIGPNIGVDGFVDGHIYKVLCVDTLTGYLSVVDESDGKTEIRNAFNGGLLTTEEAKEQLLQHGLADTEDEAMADVQYWAFKQDHPEVDADDQWFDTYYAKVAKSGLDIDVYIEYRNKVSAITGEGKKDRRMEIIHALPITKAQKDALYLAEGWAESKLSDAPWH